MTAFLALFHGVFKSVYPYIAIALLGLLCYGLWEKHKADVASLSQMTLMAQESQEAMKVLEAQEQANKALLERLGALHNKLAQDTEKAIHEMHQIQDPSGCIDQPHPSDVGRLLNTAPER